VSKGTNWVGVFLSLTWRWKQIQFPKCRVFVLENTGWWKKSKNPVILCFIHYRQNPSDFKLTVWLFTNLSRYYNNYLIIIQSSDLFPVWVKYYSITLNSYCMWIQREKLVFVAIISIIIPCLLRVHCTILLKLLLILCKIWGFHGCRYEECRLLGCGAM
jgi:hypothetical protein